MDTQIFVIVTLGVEYFFFTINNYIKSNDKKGQINSNSFERPSTKNSYSLKLYNYIIKITYKNLS